MTRPKKPEAGSAAVAAYLSTLPDDKRAALQALREQIAAAAPAAEEGISYSMPAFRYRGRLLVAYLAAARHCSLFPGAELLEVHRAQLEGYSTSKGTIRFTPGRPIPAEVVASIVAARMAQIDGAGRRG